MSRVFQYEWGLSDFHDKLFAALGAKEDGRLDTKAVAESIGVDPATITGRWGKGGRPNSKNMIAICKFTGKPAEWFQADNPLNSDTEHIKSEELEEPQKSDTEHRKTKESVNSIHRTQQPALYGVLDVIVESDRPDAITAVKSIFRGIVLMISESSDSKELRRIRKLLDQLLESRAPSKKRPKAPAPDAGM